MKDDVSRRLGPYDNEGVIKAFRRSAVRAWEEAVRSNTMLILDYGNGPERLSPHDPRVLENVRLIKAEEGMD